LLRRRQLHSGLAADEEDRVFDPRSWLRDFRSRGAVATIDLALLRLESRLRRFYRWHERFGLAEALLWSRQIDGWLRYNHVLRHLPAGPGPLRILELGAGPEGLCEVLRYAGLTDRYELTVTDIVPEFVAAVPRRPPVVATCVADGCQLPFRDNAFDVAVSVDSLEHVPAGSRQAYVAEMTRVARTRVIIHCPADDGAEYRGRSFDQTLQRWHIDTFGRSDRNTAEHLASVHPDPRLITSWLPGASLRGTQQGRGWLRYMKTARTPVVRFTSGVRYLVRDRRSEDTPPYHACLVLYDRH
jgi:SAM-dependent methyltransferase